MKEKPKFVLFTGVHGRPLAVRPDKIHSFAPDPLNAALTTLWGEIAADGGTATVSESFDSVMRKLSGAT